MNRLFTLVTFVSATLTFVLEPLVAKMLLPRFGGSPSVWNTCVLFFQAMLLAGYGYAHLLGSSRGWRRGLPIHLMLMGLACLFGPVALDSARPPSTGIPPVLDQLLLLLAIAGGPFFVVSATTPLVQRWLAGTGHPAGRDPYPLYAASNLGSLIALLSYPLVLEPMFDLAEIGRLWNRAYLLLVLLMAAGAVWTWKAAPRSPPTVPPISHATPGANPGARERWRWMALAFVPSSLMLGVTTHLSTDVASAPLLWVLPLALYLATYILAFARHPPFRAASIERAMPLVVIVLVIVLVSEDLEPPPWLLFPVHLGSLSVIALACHGQLAERRPAASRLTEFYLWIALGGLAGGVFNALVAPAVFDGIAEYPIVLVLACLLRRPPRGSTEDLPRTPREWLARDAGPALAIGLAVPVLAFLASTLRVPEGPPTIGLSLGLPVVASYLLLMRPVRFALAVGALFLAASWSLPSARDVVFASRTYYGLHRVRRDGSWTRLYHGPTLHGIQDARPERRREPLAYYHRSGPAGSLFRALEERDRTPARVAVVGAGIGTLAAYGSRGQHWTFHELDPTVIDLARNSGFFTYWTEAEVEPTVVEGDARLSLEREESEPYDLIVLDAFSSDAVPAHLLTREALGVYRRRLATHGVLAFHLSNRFLDLESVVLGLARDAGLPAVSRADLVLSESDRAAGKLPSHWMVLTTDVGLIDALGSRHGWSVPPSGSTVLWTDRFSNLLGVFRWSG